MFSLKRLNDVIYHRNQTINLEYICRSRILFIGETQLIQSRGDLMKLFSCLGAAIFYLRKTTWINMRTGLCVSIKIQSGNFLIFKKILKAFLRYNKMGLLTKIDCWKKNGVTILPNEFNLIYSTKIPWYVFIWIVSFLWLLFYWESHNEIILFALMTMIINSIAENSKSMFFN